MSERWLLVNTDSWPGALAWRLNCQRVIHDPSVPKGQAFAIDPDTYTITDLRTRVTKTARDLWPEEHP